MKHARILTRCGSLILLLLLLLNGPAGAQAIDFGKSYINLSKPAGGTLETGDTLEIRAAFVVRTGSFDSCAYFDNIPAGTAYIPGTVRVLTNEGKIYKQFTDGPADDEGWTLGTAIRINLGFNQTASPARWFRRGTVANTHRPSFYGSSCIMIASFRVRVTAAFGSSISIGGGSMTYKSGTSALQTHTFPANTVRVYRNFGICANSVGGNALGTESNGTFGSGRPRNRGTSANVPAGYTYNIFNTNSPQDYYYGVANNTSTRVNYTTSNAWPKPDNSSPTHRVFNVWDIIGDHTGAANPAMGNPAADTVANGNAGYMLVVNAAYRIDSAFQQTIYNLCPNTYYEISCWMRNICSRCGCDSAGRGASAAGYIPSGTGDSSGVQPNITFEVDGVDYYSTGNIPYSGHWVKKGFTFLTGPSQTSFTLKFFNNAPGGGGNDWALDDIQVATCSPNLAFTPTNNPTVCDSNVVDIGCFVRSYFDNYRHWKWQRSNDDGATWMETGYTGTYTPSWNGSEWEYFVAYPQFVATLSDSGAKFRVVVATTSSNLASTACSFSEFASVLTLNVIRCGPVLDTRLLSFSGEASTRRLSWTASAEEGAVRYVLERSDNGRDFAPVYTTNGHGQPKNILNHYSWTDPRPLYGATWYRVALEVAGARRYAPSVRLQPKAGPFDIRILDNPFGPQLRLEADLPAEGRLRLLLLDSRGALLLQEERSLPAGTHGLQIETPPGLPAGAYSLQAAFGGAVLGKKIVKK